MKLKNKQAKPGPPADKTRSTAGCTACTVLITADKIICANVGDSRAVCSSGGGPAAEGGSFAELSKDHKPSQEEEKARIEASGHKVNLNTDRVDGCLALSRSLGDLQYKDNPDLPPEK